MLIRLVKQDHPDYLVFCYDRKEPSFRVNLYPEYKANRTEIPPDLGPQIPYIKKFADLLGIPSFEIAPYEADDLIGTLAKWAAEEQGCFVSIVSGDKDFGQLVSESIELYDTMKEVRYTPAGVFEKWGVHPAQMIDYLALVGDTSDNVPGVDGVGPKTAQKLLQQYGTIPQIYAHLADIKGTLQAKLAAAQATVPLSQELVTIVTDVPMPKNLAAYTLRETQKAELQSLLQELNFKNLEKTLAEWPFFKGDLSEASGAAPAPATENKVAPNQQTSTSDAKPESKWQRRELTVKDLTQIKFGGSSIWTFFIDPGLYLADPQEHVIYQCQGDLVEWGPALAGLSVTWSGYDLKQLWHLLKWPLPKFDEQIHNQKGHIVWDGCLAAYVLNPGHNMEFARVIERVLLESAPELLSPEEWVELNLRLQEKLRMDLQDTAAGKVLETQDLPLLPILYAMETRGITLNVADLATQSSSLAEDLRQIEGSIASLAGSDLNVASPKQLAIFLFEKLGLPPGKKTKTGFSTDNDVLEGLRDKHPIIADVLRYRELAKLKNTYVDALPSLVDSAQRLHTTFNQALTATGRLSSTDPNLQNIPIKTSRGALIRRAFVAGRGFELLSVDYSQIELRILAHYSEDPQLCKAFAEDLDVHTATAAEIFSVPISDVTSEQRRSAKAVNFGIAYGQGAFGLAESLGISRREATEIIERYFAKFPGVRSYIDSTIELAKKQGYVETLFGRRRYMDELKSPNPAMRKFGERAAINAPIQGTASDIVKLAMIRVVPRTHCQLLLQVHDELIFEGTQAQIAVDQDVVRSVLENIVTLKVPLRVNIAVGANWGQAH